MASALGAAAASSTTDPAALLNTQLASALSTLGDAQFWEETISPSTIRTELSSCDPSNANSTPTLLKGMKWLLASISKGRDVSDFYPHVVKLVGATSLEVRKMVYMYLVQYADHDATTRELSLLSINSFQRGLADHEQLIRALALRVLSSIRINDILQIQILGVQKCATDQSPYVRKCAANALAKLSPRCDPGQRELLLEIMTNLLNTDTSTMVLSSALIAFCELCPERLELIHQSFRKICHLLTDMDEWGQVAILEVLSRYCRKFFAEPKGWKNGTAEQIDRARRVRRSLYGIVQEAQIPASSAMLAPTPLTAGLQPLNSKGASSNPGGYSDTPNANPNSADANGRRSIVFSDTAPKKVKRRVVVEGFYSDEEDQSAEEEVYAESTAGKPMSTAAALRQPSGSGIAPTQSSGFTAEPSSQLMGTAAGGGATFGTTNTATENGDEDWDLDEDHKLLLQSAMPLLRSRNAGVVLGVCSLIYYCGVSSVSSRSKVGKALVRIHRGRREIQYVVLTSVRTLVNECPSAFSPFLNDFFIKALDPPHTRIIKLDILVSLALEPAAIEAVLSELRTYIRNHDEKFVSASIRAVGKVAELARIVYDRHGQSGDGADPIQARQVANRIALDCLYGLVVVTQSSKDPTVAGDAVCVMQNILSMLWSDSIGNAGSGGLMSVEDPNEIQNFAIRRLLILLIHTLSARTKNGDEDDDSKADGSDNDEPEETDLEKMGIELPTLAVAAAVWIIGEWMSFGPGAPSVTPSVDGTTKTTVRLEILRVLDQVYPALLPAEREQTIHFASKVVLSHAVANFNGSPMDGEIALCEHILALGRIDVTPDVKDQARMESAILHVSAGLKHDLDNLEMPPTVGKSISVDEAKKLVLERKPAPSFLPVREVNSDSNKRSNFRFGTLSSLMGHQARGTYLALPSWASKNSPRALRDPIEVAREQVSGVPSFATKPSNNNTGSGFYGDDSQSSSDSSSDDSSSSDSSVGDDADSESDDSSSSSDSGAAGKTNLLMAPPTSKANGHGGFQDMSNMMNGNNLLVPMAQSNPPAVMQPPIVEMASSSDSSDGSSSDSSSSSSSSDDDYNGDVSSANVLSPPGNNLLSMGPAVTSQGVDMFASQPPIQQSSTPSAMDDLKGLVMAPIAIDASKASNPDIERDSSAWIQLVRPELCGGLSARARYLRGPSRAHEMQLKGLDSNLPNTVCVQVQFGNEKSDSNSLRRIKMLPRSSSAGAFAVKKLLCPPEIPELKKGQVSNVTLGIVFASMSNREGDMVARFDIKSSVGGGSPVELKPSLGDLLLPQNVTSVADFDSKMSRMQGFQRVTSKFQTSNLVSVPMKVMKGAALTPVGDLNWSDNKLRLVGGLPSSNDIVYVLFECAPNSGGGTITVCCDHAVAVNNIMNLLKHAVSAN